MRRLSLLLLTACLSAQSPPPPSPLKALDFLLGDWVAEGQGDPGKGAGEYSFRAELNGRIIVRRSFNQIEKSRHQDLMVIHADGGGLFVTYWDSEGHTISYIVQVSGRRALFTSKSEGPHYRLDYVRNADILEGSFGVAPPGGQMKTYLTWTSRPKR